jgi:hypothetical protein
MVDIWPRQGRRNANNLGRRESGKLSHLKGAGQRQSQPHHDLKVEVRGHAVIIGANDVRKTSLLRLLNMLLGSTTAQLYQQAGIADLRDAASAHGLLSLLASCAGVPLAPPSHLVSGAFSTRTNSQNPSTAAKYSKAAHSDRAAVAGFQRLD